MNGGVPAARVALAHRLVSAAGVPLRQHFRTALGAERKGDASPVTLADRGAEMAMRDILSKDMPHDGVWGEEFGAENVDAEWVWVMDPLDGTRAFRAGKPMFGILLGLLHKGVPVLGIIDQPVLNERWAGGVGWPAQMNGRNIAVSAETQLTHASLNATSPSMFSGKNATAMQQLSSQVADMLWGGDAYAYGLMCMGLIDMVVEADLKPHDFCALAPVVQAAGGIMTDWQGAPLHLNSDGRVIAAATPALWQAAQNILGAA
ncbi:MAG: histidinol phosphate phosphatase [Alphaproteobacteria bacterium]|nr:histidinol phosphate phosphatase [Alphaproteobacteria bacterium]NDC55805.1 histidinol phosphate phosphatase [Alphaproteobacteria bacterium]